MNPLLDIRDVSKHFGGVEAVRSVSFSVACGSLVGLIGPNGAGKTTLVNLLSKQETPNAGSILLDTVRIDHLPAFKVVRQGLSRTYQQNRLFPEESVGENILTALIWSGASEHSDLSYPGARGTERERADALLEFFELTAYRDDRPGDLSHLLRRRVEIAQALATGPKLLLLDEPFAGFSQDESFELIQHLRDCQSGGLTMLLIDHNMDVVMDVCEHLFVMHHGALLAAGTPEEIHANEDVVNVYLGGEF